MWGVDDIKISMNIKAKASWKKSNMQKNIEKSIAE